MIEKMYHQNMIGSRARVKVVKNKMAPPFRQAEFDIFFNQGISRTGELIDLGVTFDLVEKSGSWYSYGSERIGQGRENAKKWMGEHPEAMEELEAKIMEASSSGA